MSSSYGTSDRRGDESWVRRHPIALGAAVLALVVAAGVLYVLRRRAQHPGEAAAAPPVVSAGIGTARIQDFTVLLTAIGTIAARPGYAAQVGAPAATRVIRLRTAPGDRVRRGQPLVDLDVSVWTAQARQAEIALATAQREHARVARLVELGILPAKEVDSAAVALATAQANLAAAKRTLTLGTVRSPIDGVVTTVAVTVGKPVDAAQPLVEIVDPRGLEAIFHLSPAQADSVAPGDSVLLSAIETTTARDSTAVVAGTDHGKGTDDGTDTGPGPSAVPGTGAVLATGTVRGVSAAIDSTGSVEVRATIAVPGRPLKVGEVVSGHIVVAVHPNAVVVPVDALVPTDGGFQVFRVDADSVAHATPVTVGARTTTSAEILHGLHGGEAIVTRNAYDVEDGARIRTARSP